MFSINEKSHLVTMKILVLIVFDLMVGTVFTSMQELPETGTGMFD
jgi:hypothetical protein